MAIDPTCLRASRLTLLLAIGLLASWARGQYVMEDIHDPKRYGHNFLALPFAFYTPTDRFGGGVIWQSTGLLQPQADSSVLAFGNYNETYGFQGSTDDWQIKPIERLFASTQFGVFRYNFDKIYINGNPFYTHKSAGTNRSVATNFISRRHNDDWGNVELKYLLPIGGGRDTIITHYKMENGLMVGGETGGHDWNPLRSGRTYLTLTPFLEYQTIEDPHSDLHLNENGLRFGAVYDNTDFPLNPSRGNLSKITFSRDFGLFDTSGAWSNISAEYQQYIDLGNSAWFRQQVIAGDFWTSYSPTWKTIHGNGQREIVNGPPFYDGANLGGPTRLRGFALDRFWDRAAIYGTVELRLTLRWNPFENIKILKPADLTWLQLVMFGEFGRVAPVYSPAIFSHLKGDAGFGVNLLANDTLIRFNIAVSNEEFGIYAALNQPF